MTTQFISTHHAECFNSFTALLANPPALGGADGTVPTGEITEEFNRYRIWADNVGAGQYGANYKLSLDYHLREALFYKDQVIKILQRLDNIIQKIREVRKGVGRNLYTDTESHSDTDDSDSQTGPDDFDSSEEHSDWAISSSEGEYEVPRRVVSGLSDRLSSKSLSEVPNEELAQLLNSLKLTIAALYKLPVRKPAPVNRLDRLTQTADQTSLYEHSDIMFVRDAFKEAHPDLVTRLGRMNTRRRRLLHYRRSHNEKLKREMVESQASQDEQAISALQPLAEFAAIPNQDAGEETATRSVAFKSQRNETSRATTFRPDPAQLLVPPLDDMDVQSLPQSVSSSPSSDAGKEFLVIPPRPRDAENTELVDFECPYCCVTCHIRGSHTWEKHIMRDLEAYVCTFNGCDRANDMFGNREDWYKHETQEHRFEYSCNTEGHERMNDVAEFRSHMDTEHNVKFRDDQLSSQLTMFARPTRQLSGICPLCNQAKSRLKRHLGRHLERIALFSLPRQVDTEDEPVSGSGNISVQIVHHSNVGEPPEETSQPEDAEDRSARSSSEEGNENGNNADPEASPISGGPPGTDYANMEQTEVPETTAFSWDYATQKFKDARKRPEAPGPELDISSPKAQIVRYGLTQVFAPLGGGKVDVVFVHGLYGAPDLTWTSEKSKVFWPQDLLPPVLEEEMARILVYGYDADITSFTDSTSRNKIYNHAEHLIAGLAANRRIRNATERPIIFVAHSLGGLLVKRALTYSSELRGNHTVHLRSIFVSTYGILFLGTPHASDLARWGTVLQNVSLAMLPLKFFRGNAEKVKALKQSNETMGNIDRQFGELMSRFHTYFFHELKPSDLAGQKVFVVSVESASPFILQDVERAGIPSDHAHLSKFESENSPGFDLVAEAIERYATEAPDVIATRWQLEKAEILAIKRNQLEELLPVRTGSNSQASPPNVDTTDELPPFSYGRRNTNSTY